MKRRITASQKLEIQNAVQRARAHMKGVDDESGVICRILSCRKEDPAGPQVQPRRFQSTVDDHISDTVSDSGDVDDLLEGLGVTVE